MSVRGGRRPLTINSHHCRYREQKAQIKSQTHSVKKAQNQRNTLSVKCASSHATFLFPSCSAQWLPSPPGSAKALGRTSPIPSPKRPIVSVCSFFSVSQPRFARRPAVGCCGSAGHPGWLAVRRGLVRNGCWHSLKGF